MAGGSTEGQLFMGIFVVAKLKELGKLKPKSIKPRTYWGQWDTQQVMSVQDGCWVLVTCIPMLVAFVNSLCPDKPISSNLEALAHTTSAPGD